MLFAWFPHRTRLFIGKVLGIITFRLAKERRYITETNIRLCFPELDNRAKDKLVYEAFIANGIGLIETGASWVRSAKHFVSLAEIKNLEVLTEAQNEGKGVLLLGAHFSTLDLGANILSAFCPFAVTYRPHRNPLFDAFMHRGRQTNCESVIDRYDIRGAFRHLKQGKILWYAPDQDYGPEHAVYAPFFGQNAATITATSRFAAINHSAVVLVRHHRSNQSGLYDMEFTRVNSSDFPTGDDKKDATLINGYIEKAIRHNPEQYLWMHKRFKTQPGGKPESPYINIKTPNNKLTLTLLERILEDSSQLSLFEERPQKEQFILLNSGRYGRLFSGLATRYTPHHEAMILDKKAKHLRTRGISTITIDNLFRIPDKKETLVSFFLPEGKSLKKILNDSGTFPTEALAEFFLHCHDEGIYLTNFDSETLLAEDNKISLSHPEQTRFYPSDLCMHDRLDNLVEIERSISKHAGNKTFPHNELFRLYLKKSKYNAQSMLWRQLVLKYQL